MRPALESRIDDLYQQPLADFVSARTALAKTLTGDEAKRVKALAKPTVVPWAVNQVYWRARPTFDAVMKTGDRLRNAQVAALEGKDTDVRAASEAHRRAIADAVKAAERVAASDGSKPSPEALMRTFEALSLSMRHDEAPGRLTRPLQPAAFEALAGIKVKAPPPPPPPPKLSKREDAALRKEEAEHKKREAAVKQAEAALERARKRVAAAEAQLRDTREH